MKCKSWIVDKKEIWKFRGRQDPWQIISFVVGALVFLLLQFRILIQNESGQMRVQSLGVWLDWPMHLSFISWFSNQPPQNWMSQYPLAINFRNNYPPAVDLLGSLGVHFGLDPLLVIRILGFAFCMTLLCALYLWAKSIFRDGIKAALLVALFFSKGGTGELVTPVPNFVLGCFLNSPAFPLGLALLCFSLLYFHRVWQGERISRFQLALLSLIPAVLILTHIHSLLILFVIAAVYSGMTLLAKRPLHFWIRYGLLSAVLGLPILYWELSGQVPRGFFQLVPGMSGVFFHENLFQFWWKATGILIPLSVVAAVRKRFYLHPLWISAWCLFLIYNFVLIQTNPYDNLKFLVFDYALFCIPVADGLADLLERRALFKRIGACAALLFLTLPGILDFSHVILGDCDSFLLTTKQDRQLAEAFQRQSQPSDVVLVPAKHHHWSLLWTGRPAVLGMRYFVWVHGIDAHELDRDVADIYAGGPKALDLLRKYSVRYVVTESGQFYENSRDQKLMGFMDQFFSPVVINESFFAARFPLVMDNGTEKVFRIPTE